MKIISLKVMRGPNYWSNYRKKLIVMKLDLEEYNEVPSNAIPGFNARLKKLLPSLHDHRCSVGAPGGFLKRLDLGTLLGHVTEHVALELQWLAGMKCGYGRARETYQKNVYHVVFSYEIENAGIFAAETAVKIVTQLAKNQEYTALENNIEELKNIYQGERLGPTTEAIITEAKARNIPFMQLSSSLYILGQGCNQRMISASMTHFTSSIGVDIAGDKDLTKEILQAEFIPTPKGITVYTEKELENAILSIGFPLVIKPRYGNHGRSITTHIYTAQKALEAFKLAREDAASVIVEKFITGTDYRFLIINYKIVAVAKRIPAHVVGDGTSTIEKLIHATNNDPKRGKYHENSLTEIEIDEATLTILKEKKLSLTTVLAKDEVVYLKYAANISKGGTAIDVTKFVHPYNMFLAERIARLVHLDVCGIDIIAKDISLPLKHDNGAVLEVNAAPGFRMHLNPNAGSKINVAKPFIEMLYPQNIPSRIPLTAVTGTNGKTTVVRLLSYLASYELYTVGMSTTEGIYINNVRVYDGDCSGPTSAHRVLRDPLVNFAVLECARGGILRSGLGFDHCNVSIVTNISADHLGSDDIYTLNDLAKVKAVVPHSTFDHGYAILNADDDLVYSLKEDLVCNIALFSLSLNDRIKQHCSAGGMACYIRDGSIYMCVQKEETYFINASDIPITFGGRSKSMKQNILPVILAAWINNFSVKNIVTGLMNFFPSEETLPGRMNILKFENCTVLVDYAHNEQAYILLKEYFEGVNAKKKIGLVAGTGDRRPIDIYKTGVYAAEIFDEIIIRHDKDSRGKTHDEITHLILKGIRSVKSNASVRIIPDEFEAIESVISEAAPGTFVWHFPDNVLKSLDFLKNLRLKKEKIHG